MTTTIITPEIASFAEAVRDALHDLPHEERDELTEGLEADLAEAYAEDLLRELPDPDEYATELRNAAGLPKDDAPSQGMAATVRLAFRRMRSDLAEGMRRNPALASVAEFLIAIRPVWWMVRAWVAAWLFAGFLGLDAGFLPTSGLTWVVLLGFLLVSIQWGRGRWSASRLTPLIALGNIAAVLLVLPVATMAGDWSTQVNYSYVDGGPGDLTGVYLDGEQVTNIFPYGADGKPLKDVQLFTDSGQPLRATVDGADGCIDPACTQIGLWVPRTLVGGDVARNVYPMGMVPEATVGGYDPFTVDPDASVLPRTLPFPTAQKVAATKK